MKICCFQLELAILGTKDSANGLMALQKRSLSYHCFVSSVACGHPRLFSLHLAPRLPQFCIPVKNHGWFRWYWCFCTSAARGVCCYTIWRKRQNENTLCQWSLQVSLRKSLKMRWCHCKCNKGKVKSLHCLVCSCHLRSSKLTRMSFWPENICADSARAESARPCQLLAWFWSQS